MRLLSEIRNFMGNYHVKSGVYHYYRSEFSQAISFLRKSLADGENLAAADQENARGYLTLALMGLAEKMAAAGDAQGGIEELTKATQVSPSYPDLHFMKARLFEGLGRRDEAVAAYRRAIEAHPGYLEARVALGYCLLAAGMLKDASKCFEEALQLKLERIHTPFRRGVELLEQGKIDAALESIHDVFLSAPRLSDEYLKKALGWMRVQEHERALGDLDLALEACPRYPDLHNFRGIVLCELGRYDDAAGAFRRSAELCPGHKVPLLNLAFTYIRAGRLEQGETELESILQTDPTEPVALASLAKLRSGRLTDKRAPAARSRGA